MLENWLCDSDLDNPTRMHRILIEKDLFADSFSDCLEASILDENEFLLLKVISTLPELSRLICSMVGVGLGIEGRHHQSFKWKSQGPWVIIISRSNGKAFVQTC